MLVTAHLCARLPAAAAPCLQAVLEGRSRPPGQCRVCVCRVSCPSVPVAHPSSWPGRRRAGITQPQWAAGSTLSGFSRLRPCLLG